MTASIRLISFGYLHGDAPEADLTVDTRRFLRDPARMTPELLDSDGRDDAVQQVVLNTTGAHVVLSLTQMFANAMSYADKPCVIAIGCAGGRHRSAALVELLAESLVAVGKPVTVRHLHIHLPRVLRDGKS